MKLFKILFLPVMVLSFISCKNEKKTEPAQILAKVADSLAQAIIITDGHIDLPYALMEKGYSGTEDHLQSMVYSTQKGDFDYIRAKKGGLDAPFMSIYVSSDFQITGGAFEMADSLIDLVEGIIKGLPQQFASAKTPSEVESNWSKGLISLPMGMENGAPIGNDLSNISYFRNRGISYITLTHAKDNQICDSSYDTARTWGGLSPFGKQVIEEMNRVGIMIDISHVSDSTFYQVLRLTKVPVIASHSSCRNYTPGWERNMSDQMLKALGENGGVIQVNFGTDFLDGDISAKNKENEKRLSELLKEKGLETESDMAKAVIDSFRNTHPVMYSNVKRVADHIVKWAGIDHVGLGSDFDGVGDSLPEGLKDVSMFPNLIEELLLRNYTHDDIAKICYKNVWRVWNQTTQVSELK